MKLREQALRNAGLWEILEQRLSGKELLNSQLSSLKDTDILLLGTMADWIRQHECGDEVVLYENHLPDSSDRLCVVSPDPTLQGTALLRSLALTRLQMQPAVHLCLDYSQLGLSFAQIALSFGVTDLSGPVEGGGELPILNHKTRSKRAEIIGVIQRAQRTVSVVVPPHRAPAHLGAQL
jgi:hypothetical protein